MWRPETYELYRNIAESAPMPSLAVKASLAGNLPLLPHIFTQNTL